MKDKTSPWCPIDVAWWPAIAEALPHPWPDEAAKMDLRWWADQEAMGRELSAQDGQPWQLDGDGLTGKHETQ